MLNGVTTEVSALPPPFSPQVWSDVYGALHARYAARAGKHAWLVAAAPETAWAAAEALVLWQAGEGRRLKGHLELLVHDTLLPLERTLREQRSAGCWWWARRWRAGRRCSGPSGR